MDGLEFSGDTLWNHLICGGLQTWSKSLYSGTSFSSPVSHIEYRFDKKISHNRKIDLAFGKFLGSPEVW